MNMQWLMRTRHFDWWNSWGRQPLPAKKLKIEDWDSNHHVALVGYDATRMGSSETLVSINTEIIKTIEL